MTPRQQHLAEQVSGHVLVWRSHMVCRTFHTQTVFLCVKQIRTSGNAGRNRSVGHPSRTRRVPVQGEKPEILLGLVEIFVAGALGVVTAKQMTAPSPLIGAVAALIGAIYVVSRGAGNIADGWKKASSANRGDA
jgi:hypothetical protein